MSWQTTIARVAFGVGALAGCTAPPARTSQSNLVSSSPYYESCFSQKAFDHLMSLSPQDGKPAFVIHRTADGGCVPVTLCSKTPGQLEQFLRLHEFTDAVRFDGMTQMDRPVSQQEARDNGVIDLKTAAAFLQKIPECRRTTPARVTAPL